ncbi:hypothetical protein CHS0354_034600 [Potamilus streckersoni]|uniref:Globin domain-containing protein n=1 Tax=Potamilus streckersoni TaxID=2493646 RepID=A0AAE0ST01_9BIVA|nr:hypothetical protein CHS0354_034600 [Potamilus streckersoni]
MGCLYSKNRKEALRKNKTVTTNSKKKYLTQNLQTKDNVQCNGIPQNFPEITEEQKRLIMESWNIIQTDMAKVGVVMFMNLFETHPDVQDVFMPFKGLTREELRQNSELKTHALRVMGTVEKCLARINEPKKVIEMLHDLGARHIMYTAKVDYIDLIGPQFILAIAPNLGDKWTTEAEEAWSDLFKMIACVMKGAMSF